jgi:alpha-L-fucosidase
VGHNTTLILGVTPNAEGRMPEPDVKRLKEFGEEINRRFSHPLGQTSGTGNIIYLVLDEEKPIDHIILQENISKGERVREFKLEAKINGEWTEIYKGSSIGHKHIVAIDAVNTESIRFVALSSIGEPQLKSISVYKIDPQR